jgi:hypothetical protein
MSDQSLRQTMTKSVKSPKQKRAEKRAKTEHSSSTEAQLHSKKHWCRRRGELAERNRPLSEF